jgi:hypothetical protein
MYKNVDVVLSQKHIGEVSLRNPGVKKTTHDIV